MAVSFASESNRRLWQASVLVSALHLGIAFAIGHAISGPYGDGPWLIGALVYGAFLALSIVWWLSRQVVGWLVWRVLWRAAAINDLVASFQKFNFPKPDHFLSSADLYFESIINDVALEFETRMAAVTHYLRMTEFARQQGIWAGIRASNTYEEAIKAYWATFPAVGLEGR